MTFFVHIFKSLLISLISITLVMTGALWLTQSLKFIDLIVSSDITISDYIILISLMIPEILAIIIPICLIFSGIWIYYKMMVNHEYIVMQSIGFSKLRIVFPLLVIGVSASLFVCFLNFFLIPKSFKSFDTFKKILKNKGSFLAKEGTFLTLSDATIYIDEKQRDGSMKLILIDKTNDYKNFTSIIAKIGFYDKKNKVLLLRNAYRQAINNGKLETTFFDNITYNTSSLLNIKKDKKISTYEKSIKKLLNPPEKMSFKQRKYYKKEGHSKILFPIISIINILLIVRLFLNKSEFKRKFQKRKIFIVIVPIFGNFVLFHSFLNLWGQKSFSIFWIYGVYILLLLFLMFSKRVWKFY